MPGRGLTLALAIAVLILAADQVSKTLVIALMAGRGFEPLDVTANLSVVMVWNRGVSFGMLSGGDETVRWAFTGLAFAVAAGLVVWAARVANPWQAAAAGLVAGGAVGNGVDRIMYGAVADFIDLHAGRWSWPAFNVADSAITAGIALLLVHALLSGRRGR